MACISARRGMGQYDERQPHEWRMMNGSMMNGSHMNGSQMGGMMGNGR